MTPPLRIQLRKIDHDDFTVYRWGEIEDGEIVKRYPEGEERFGPVDDIVEESIKFFPPDADPANPFHWVCLWHNYGTQAQHARADVVHPDLDRHLWGIRNIPAIGALQGIEHPESSVETVTVLERTDGSDHSPGTALVVRFEVGEARDSINLGTQSTVEAAVHPTMANVIRFALDGVDFCSRHESTNVDRIVVVAVASGRTICRVEITVDRAASIDWQSYDATTLAADAAVYYSTADGWQRDVDDRYKAYVQAIDAADSYAELLAAVARYGPVQGSKHEYSTADLSQVITSFRDAARAGTPADEVKFRRMTRTLGLRAKCRALYDSRSGATAE